MNTALTFRAAELAGAFDILRQRSLRLGSLYEPDLGQASASPQVDVTSIPLRVRARGDRALVRAIAPALATLWRRGAVVRLADLPSHDDTRELAGAILRLVMDGVIEIEIAGQYVTGPAAGTRLFDGAPAPKAATARIAELSLAALRHVARLPGLDSVELAGRLYHYGSRPLASRLHHKLPNRAAAERFLACDELERRHGVCRAWQRCGNTPGWLQWQHVEPPSRRGRDYKLYVGIGIDDLAAAFERIAVAAADGGAHAMKVGASAHGLLRPDKAVIYQKSFTRLQALARSLVSQLAGARSEPVPFTADAAADGLLSWAVDPHPRSRESLLGRSWRVWTSRTLGDALAVARIAGCDDTEPAAFALRRLSLENVDVAGWRPLGAFGRPQPRDEPICST
jgi:hypothetical protein